MLEKREFSTEVEVLNKNNLDLSFRSETIDSKKFGNPDELFCLNN